MKALFNSESSFFSIAFVINKSTIYRSIANGMVNKNEMLNTDPNKIMPRKNKPDIKIPKNFKIGKFNLNDLKRYIAHIKLPKHSVATVAILAPLKLYLGISNRLRNIFKKTISPETYKSIFCLPKIIKTFTKIIPIYPSTSDQISIERAELDGKNLSPYNFRIIRFEKTVNMIAMGRINAER
jgi:hypothetical protein